MCLPILGTLYIKGIRLTDHVLKIVERVIEKCIREIVKFQEMQLGFVAEAGAYNTILILKITGVIPS